MLRPVEDATLLRSFMGDEMMPKETASVGSLEEASETLKAANSQGLAVIPQGSGTMMGLGNLLRRADVLLEVGGLRRVLEHNPENLTVTTECGLSLGELREVLAEKGQFLPLDPPLSSATLGGIISCNASGPKRLIYGVCRDMILGMKVILADGSVINSGGRCVKNVSGLDLCKLFIGSLGTLGVIAEATFKVHPLPEEEAIQVGWSSDAGEAFQLCRSVIHSVLFPAALEILDPHLADLWCRQMGSQPTEKGWLTLLGWAGFAEDVRRCLRDGQVIFRSHNMMEGGVYSSDAAQKGWEALGHLPQSLESPVGGLVCCRMCLLLDRLQEGAQRWQEEVSQAGGRSALSVRAGSGILYGYLLDAHQNPEASIQAVERMRKWTVGMGGNLVVESAPVWLKKRVDVWGTTGKELILMKRLKAHFDPRDVLNPGRYVGGI